MFCCTHWKLGLFHLPFAQVEVRMKIYNCRHMRKILPKGKVINTKVKIFCT